MLDARLMESIAEKKMRLEAKAPLAPGSLERAWWQLLVEWTYHSNAIEESDFSLEETCLLLQSGATCGARQLRHHYWVINHINAIHYVQDLVDHAVLPAPEHVRQIHRRLFEGLDDVNAGCYRETQVNPGRADWVLPEPWWVRPLMINWEDWVRDAEAGVHPIGLAALAHQRLAAIHPFLEGNGRTARLVMNWLLMRAGYPPAVIERAQRANYLRALAQADMGRGNWLVNLVGQAVERSLDRILTSAMLP
jgi:Fic family protein